MACRLRSTSYLKVAGLRIVDFRPPRCVCRLQWRGLPTGNRDDSVGAFSTVRVVAPLVEYETVIVGSL